jgi:hypothetical protein
MAPSTSKATHPRRDYTIIVQLGLKALGLADKYKDAVGPRLPKDLVASLQKDVGGLGDTYASKALAKDDASLATEVQTKAAARACVRVRAIRAAVKNAEAPKEVQHAYGVGTELRATPPKVKVAIQKIIDRVKDHEEEMEAFGILAEDVDALKAALAEVTSTDMDQETKRATAPLATRERNVVANRVVRAVLRISAAGMMAFADQQDEHAEFAEIDAAAKRTKKSQGEAEAPEAVAAEEKKEEGAAEAKGG